MTTLGRLLAFFEAADAAIIVAIISAVAAIVGPVVLLLVASLRGIRAAAETAAHNTQPNGVPDAFGNVGEPSPFDRIVASHEYMIGQIHAVAAQADRAARAADRASLAVNVKTDELRKTVEEGFEKAKLERDAISKRLDENIERIDANGELFVEAAGGIVLGILGRLDSLDGSESVEDLKRRLELGGGGEGTPG